MLADVMGILHRCCGAIAAAAAAAFPFKTGHFFVLMNKFACEIEVQSG